MSKPQVNVQLTEEEMKELEQICSAEHIARPSTLVGIWIRENITSRSEALHVMQLVREASDTGVDVQKVLARAIRNARGKAVA